MRENRQDFVLLMEQVKAGSNEAIRRLLEQYGDHILRAIRRKLNRQIRKQFDSQDFFQAVCASFFRRRSMVTRFKRPEELAAFLGSVAGNKVIDECRRQLLAQKRNVNREAESDDGESRLDQSLTATISTPSEIVSVREQIDRFFEGKPDHYRQILELRAGGVTYGDIAETTGVNERTVRRVLKRLAERIEK